MPLSAFLQQKKQKQKQKNPDMARYQAGHPDTADCD
uniref:Uncharacterized protein n=1 Tax=Anguilla anguilla TaxID=7936 RepID=A0A0E9TDR2_ANGAN